VTEKSQASKFREMIIKETFDYVVINKPCGLASQGGSGVKESVDDYLKSYLKSRDHEFEGHLVHRLDISVSGLMILGKTMEFTRNIGQMLKEGKVKKYYTAIS
jgi:23S rRNA pseudouridine955/2504/2580 synthase